MYRPKEIYLVGRSDYTINPSINNFFGTQHVGQLVEMNAATGQAPDRALSGHGTLSASDLDNSEITINFIGNEQTHGCKK